MMHKTIVIPGLLLAVLAFGCDREQEPTLVTGETPAGVAAPEEKVSVADVAGNPAAYEGRTVTIVADVEEVFGPRAFKLDEGSALSGAIDNDLVVVGTDGEAVNNIDDQWINNKVRVTGVVRQIAVIDLEREIGWDLDPEIEVELEGTTAVLVASAVERV